MLFITPLACPICAIASVRQLEIPFHNLIIGESREYHMRLFNVQAVNAVPSQAMTRYSGWLDFPFRLLR